jgi:YegS/Rv2252/BmrU family lipid kinase
MKRGFLIYNPSAGMGAKSTRALTKIVREFESNGLDVTPSPTQPDFSVHTQVRELLTHTPDFLISWGGDGTINEVVNGMFGTNIPLGVLPGGTANLFARELKIPPRLTQAVQIIVKGNTCSISVGQANQRYFLLMVGIGFDSEVIRNVDWNLKKTIGTFAFGVAAFKTASEYKFQEFSIRVDGEEKDCIFAVICNAREYAAFFQLTPEANISDEFFYVCLFKEPGFANMAKYAFHALTASHQKLKSVEILRATEVEALGSEQIPVQADGELIGYLPMKFRILPRSLQVFCP